jgi:hypothetical protein
MTGDIRRRLDAIQAAFKVRSTVLVQADSTQVVLPRAAALHAFLAFNGLRGDDDGVREAESVPPKKWIRAFAHSVPTPGEGQFTVTVREWSRRYLAGEDVTT